MPLKEIILYILDVVRDIESPVHLKPAIARSASKKRRQLRLELDNTNNLKLEDEEENDKKKVHLVPYKSLLLVGPITS